MTSDRDQEQEAQSLDGALERLRRPLEARLDGRGEGPARQRVHGGDGLPERNAGLQVEGDRHGGELPRVGHREGSGVGRDRAERGEGRELAGGGANVEKPDRAGVRLELRSQLHDDLVLVVGRVDRRDLARAVGRVERVLDLLGSDPEGGRLVPVDNDVDLRVGELQVARHVLDAGDAAHLLLELRRVLVELRRVRVLERVLVLALGEASAQADGRRHLQKGPDPGDLRELRTQVRDDLVGRALALRPGLQLRQDDSGVADADVAPRAAAGKDVGDVGVAAHDRGDLLLMRLHRGKPDPLRSLGEAEDQAGVFRRKEALGDLQEEEPGRREDEDREDEHLAG